MNDNPRADGSRGSDPYAALRLIALIAAIAGVVVLAAAAFVLSYGGIHKIALSAGVSPSVARIFPVIFDAMLVVSCAAVVSLRSAGWWQRTYSWLSTLALLVVVAAANAVHATGTHIPRKPAAATVAILPWALLLLAFTLLLSMLRQFRRSRAAAADMPVAAGVPVTGHAAAGTAPVGARPGLDILNPRSPAPQPAMAVTTTAQPSTVPSRAVAVSVPNREGAPPPESGPGLNGTGPARSADRESPGQEGADQERADQHPMGEDQAVQEQVAVEEAGEEEPSGDGHAEPAPEARPADAEAPEAADHQAPDAQPPDAQPAGEQAPDAQPAGDEAPDAQAPDAQPADAQAPDAQPADAQAPDAQPADARGSRGPARQQPSSGGRGPRRPARRRAAC